ncbi:MAG: hypothetical protein M3R06_09380, partial [Chloroflexota bacterium]|nr:hypothetical protein [Chloroflexota bacterium]
STNLIVEVENRRFDVRVSGEVDSARAKGPAPRRPPSSASNQKNASVNNSGAEVVSPVQGTIVSIAVETGQNIESGAVICVVEAMKMENEVTVQRPGTVIEVLVSAGERVGAGAVLARVGVTGDEA